MDCCGASRAVKAVRESRERTADGCTSFVRVAEVGWTHRASSASGVRKGSWSERALARRKPEALPDAEHGWREGESVRGRALVSNESRSIGLRVKARMFSIRRKALSGCCASDPHGKGVPGSFGLRVKARFSSLPQGKAETASGSDGFGDRFGRACR
jgi:hypothetical protein